WWAGPIPSQIIAGMYALGHTAVATEGSSGRTFGANVPGTFSQHIAPWGSRSDEIRFALPEFGHGLGALPTLFAPVVEHAPFSDSLALQVVNTGDCLNIRPEPSLTSTPIVCLPDGTPLDALVPATSPDANPPRASLTNDSGLWIYVRAPDGVEGWASADYLGWPGAGLPSGGS
ncbi:MAG: hypothetical protein ACRDG3_09070, partial [Tepidiformaceae bacterium]